MGILREKINASATVEIPVLVRFMNGTEGEFTGVFKRLAQERIDALADPEAEYRNSEIIDEVLVGVRGIAENDPSQELPADEQLAWVKQQPECVNAAVVAFFRRMRPARYDEKTSKKRR